MKKSLAIERKLKPNYKEQGKENEPFVFFFKEANNSPIYFPKRKKFK